MYIPKHLAIIIDGNRRWAKERGLPTLEGHKKGYDKLKEVSQWCIDRGIKILTIFAFSTENWQRSEEEVSYLMRLLKQAFTKGEIERLNQAGISLRVIGQKERLSKDLQELIATAETETKDNTKGILNLAISYGGRAEIITAVKKIIEKGIASDQITEPVISENLWTKGLPDPDLIIRTSGELRTSGFLTWQAAYAELYFSKKYWPDFTEEDLNLALLDYRNRQRRFGK